MLTVNRKRVSKPPSTKENRLLECVEKHFPENKWHVNCFYNELKSSTTGYSLQLDLYCPELKLAFEGEGESHRSFEVFQSFSPEKNTRDKFLQYQNNSKDKQRGCQQKGISLFFIDYGRDVKTKMEDQVDAAVRAFRSSQRENDDNPNFDSDEFLNDIFTILLTALVFAVFIYSLLGLHSIFFFP